MTRYIPMTRREILTEIVGSVCFLAVLYFAAMALYVLAPAQPGPNSEAVLAETLP